MDSQKVQSFLYRQGWKVSRHEGDEAIINPCPLCGETTTTKRPFYINENKGVWYTHCCGKSGSLLSLKREVGELDDFVTYKKEEKPKVYQSVKGDIDIKMYGKLQENKPTLDYLYSRGFNNETIKHFKLGSAKGSGWKCKKCGKYNWVKNIDVFFPSKHKCVQCETEGEFEPQPLQVQSLLSIPVYEDGKLVNVKFRSIEGEKRYERITGAKNSLFNVDSLDGEWKECFITEGELDAIALHQYGYTTVVSISSGAQSGPKQIEEYRDKFVDFDNIYIVTDQDEPGNECADKIADILGKYRCFRVKLPFKDINDCLMEGMTKDELQECIDKSKRYGAKVVKHVSEYKDLLGTMFNPAVFRGLRTHLKELDDLILGLRKGGYSVWTGETGAGKTTVLDRIQYNMVTYDNVPCLNFNFEMDPEETLAVLLTMSGEKLSFEMSPEERMLAFKKLETKNLFIAEKYGETPFSELEDSIEHAVRRHGIEFVKLDNFQNFLESGIGNPTELINKTIKRINILARRLNIHIAIVVHPKQGQKDRNGDGIQPDNADLKGSSSIAQDAKLIIRVSRKRSKDRDGKDDGKVGITVTKTRLLGSKEGHIDYMYDPNSLNYHKYIPLSDDTSEENTEYVNEETGEIESATNYLDF